MVRTSKNLCTVRSVALSVLSLTFAAPACAQSAVPESQRTVEFYVQNPSIRARVDRACLNDPGHLRNSPDCWNAHRANLEESVRKARQNDGDTSDPRTPAYWTARPNERRFTLAMCGHMTPEHQQEDSACAPAAASLANHP